MFIRRTSTCIEYVVCYHGNSFTCTLFWVCDSIYEKYITLWL